jgi:hypothetical protein
VVTPLLADKWERELQNLDLFNQFQDVTYGIRHGFDLGVHRLIMETHTPRNHRSATENPEAINQHISTELGAGRISGPFEQRELERQIGPFRTSPLGAIPKGDGFRVIQDLSFEENGHPSVNDEINADDFPSEWGSFADMLILVTEALPGAQAATLDVDAAFRRCPVRPEQQNHFVIQWDGRFYVDHCVAFGGASACGIFGRVADAFIAICRQRGYGPVKKWVDDFAFIRNIIDPPAGLFAYQLEDLIELGIQLGWPWKSSKTHPFEEVFKYLGFQWSLRERTVSIPHEKRERYLLRLRMWTAGCKVTQKEAEQILGTLVHCSLAVPEGRSRLVSISRFASSFERVSRFARRQPSDAVLADIQFWCTRLADVFCGSKLQRPPAPVATEFYVDASTSWGIGVVFDGKWDWWRLRPNWKTDERDIGWAEMIAIELGLRTAIAAGYSDTHFSIMSDNMGVIGALSGGKSRNLQQNRALQRIVALMQAHSIWITSVYVPSAVNVADEPSRGIPAPGRAQATRRFTLPSCLNMYIEHIRA